MKRKIDSLGRIVLPKEIRRELDLKENDFLNIELKEGKIILTIEKEREVISYIKNKIKTSENQKEIAIYKDILERL